MRHFNIPIFVPHRGCPFQCVFCNQTHITGTDRQVTPEDVRRTIRDYVKTLPKEDRFVEAAFFGGSFTGIPIDVQRELLRAAYEFIKEGIIDGIRLSTRPDYITDEILAQLATFGVTAVELGVQSMDEDVLALSQRGHHPQDVREAVKKIRTYSFSLGLQMMTGLPGDTEEKSLATAKALIGLKPDFVRIYPTLVVKDTPLEMMYRQGDYTPQTLEAAVKLCVKLKKQFDQAAVPIIRLGLMTTEEIAPGRALVAGPFHSSFGELVQTEEYYEKLVRILDGVKERDAVILVHPTQMSKVIGNRKINKNRIEQLYGIRIKIKPDPIIEKGQIILYNRERGETDVSQTNRGTGI
jgi:histone acetyltransferase (RNA polymerase elongator complex component)